MKRSAILVCLLMLVLTACGGQKTNGADAGGVNAAVTVAPTTAVVTVGETRAFTATLALGSGFAWKVVPSDLGTFDAQGVFTARRAGTGTVVASWTTDIRYVGTAPVTTVPAPVAVIDSVPTANAGEAQLEASVPAQPDCSYAWSIAGGAFVGATDGPRVAYVAEHPGQVTLGCTVTNPAGTQATDHWNVKVVDLPVITLFDGLPALVRTGAPTLLRAEYTGGTGVITPGGQAVPSGGSLQVALSATTEFTLTVTNEAGAQVQARALVLVGNPCTPQSPAAGDLWVDPATGLEMVWCPPGTFQMGAAAGDADALDNEGPAHPVTFAQGFWISRGKVTQDLWLARMGGNPAFFAGGDCLRFGTDLRRPVDQVSWEDAQEFLGRLNDRIGWDIYRLPSEAEWEYAYRAGTTSRFFWGDDADAGVAAAFAWFDADSNLQVQPGLALRGNAWKLFDLAGDLQEWTADGYLPDHDGAPVDGRPTLDLASAYRAVRGGAWNEPLADQRGSARYARPQGTRARTLGFRVVRPPCSAPVITSFTAGPAQGGQATLAWEVAGATRVRIEPGIGDVTGLDHVAVPAATRNRYVLAAENQDGWVMASVTVEVAQ